jgi:N-glycosylase/DNA lyase
MEMQNPSPAPKNSRFSPPAMDALRKENAPETTMSPLEILTKSMGDEGDPQQMMAALSKAVETNPQLRILRSNNSLLIVYNMGNGEAEVTLDTADNPKTLVNSVKEFLQALKKANYRKIKFDVDNPEIIRVIKIAGYDAQMSSVSGNEMSATVEF